jgi:hypothetical protein
LGVAAAVAACAAGELLDVVGAVSCVAALKNAVMFALPAPLNAVSFFFRGILCGTNEGKPPKKCGKSRIFFWIFFEIFF